MQSSTTSNRGKKKKTLWMVNYFTILVILIYQKKPIKFSDLWELKAESMRIHNIIIQIDHVMKLQKKDFIWITWTKINKGFDSRTKKKQKK